MLGKENTKEKVIDNQMDYVDAGSAIVDYENILSSEELQCGRSQESPRVIRSSSIGSSSTSTDDEEMFSCISITSDEIVKKATLFVKTFVKVFEEKLSECSKEAKPGSKARKTGRVVAKVASTVGSYIPPGLEKAGTSQVMEFVGFVSANQHRKKAKIFSTIVVPSEGNLRKILIEAGLEIFQSFEKQFTKIVDTNQLSCNRGIEKLAVDAVSRVINYISANVEKKEFSVDLITRGVVLGESKTDTFAKQVFHKSAKFFNLEVLQPGYQVKDEQSDKTLITSQLYKAVGIKKIEGNTIKYYQSKEHDFAEKYDYRLPFTWELAKWEEVEQKYVLSGTSKERYVSILDEEKKKGLASSILKEINENDSAKKKDIEELREEIKNLEILHKKEGKNTFSFNLGYLPKFFIKREMILDELKKKLSSENQEVEMSRMVLIHGEYGTGKSELAKSCAYSEKNDWKKVAWIDATTYSTLSQSFYNLAKELKIPTENNIDSNGVRNRNIKSIIKNIYEDFTDVKSLFIFDNASEYKEIKKFLPSHFSDLFFCKEKPYVLITSRNKSWKEEIEKIELNNGFSLGEAITFTERALGVDKKDGLQNHSLLELAEALGYLPLALAQAIAYIKQEKINIIQYLERYNKAMQESNHDFFVAQGISKELFITLEVNFDKIRGEKNIGQPACNILYCMAYLDPNQIDTEDIFLQKKSEKDKQQVSDALDLLNKFSMIKLEESMARVHSGVQKTIRVEEERAGTEEETLRKIMTLFCSTNRNHIISIWNHASKYDRLVNEFIDSLYDESTILHLLVKDGNEEVIKLILEKVDPSKLSKIVNAVDEENFTSLDYAIMHGNLDIVKYLVEKRADVNLQDEGSMSPMHWAVNIGNLEIVKYLIEKGADVNLQDEGGMSPMHWAVNIGNLEIVKYLVEKGADVNLKDEDGMSPIHWAAKSGNLEIIKYLVEKGADVDLKDEDGMSPIHWAAKSGNLDIVKYLVEKETDVDLQDEDGMSPMHWATNNGNLEIFKYLVKKGADVDLQDKDSITPLGYAIEDGNLDIVRYFVEEERIDISLMNRCGKSFLHYAVEYSSLKIFQHLLAHNATVDLRDKNGTTPLHSAAKHGSLDMFKSLVEKGAIIEAQNKDGMNPLHFAAIYGHSSIVHYLVHRSGINLHDNNHMTPLHFAAIHGHLDIVCCLVEHGANINSQNEYGMTPLHFAFIHGHQGIVDYLVKCEAKDISNIIPSLDYNVEFNSYDIDKRHYATNYYQNSMHYCGPQSTVYSASDLKMQSQRLSESKKRKSEDISAAFEENASNTQLLQGSHNLSSDISMQREGLFDRMENMVSVINDTPTFSFNRVDVEPVNNKNLKTLVMD